MIFTTTSYIPVIINLSLLLLYCSSFKSAIIGKNVVIIKICWIPSKTLWFPPKHSVKNWVSFSLKSNHRSPKHSLPHSPSLLSLYPRRSDCRDTTVLSATGPTVLRSREGQPHSPSLSLTLRWPCLLPRRHHHLQQHSHRGHPQSPSLPQPPDTPPMVYLPPLFIYLALFCFCFFIENLSWVFGFWFLNVLGIGSL